MDAEKMRIACFICNWTLPEEESDTQRMGKRSFSVSVVRLPCLGRIDPATILEIVRKGADGVLLIGCAPSDCHFIDGNVYAEQTVNMLKKLLSLTRLESERLHLRLVSPIEEASFVKIVEDFAEKLKKLGPTPLAPEKRDPNIFENVLAAKNAVTDFYLRALVAKERELTSRANAYNEIIAQREFDAFLDRAVEAEFIRHKILLATEKKPLSVRELSNEVGIKPSAVFRHVLNLRRKGMIALDHFEGRTPLYRALEA